eukprot:jgi/Mesvir1/15855/Mv03402-RA.1
MRSTGDLLEIASVIRSLPFFKRLGLEQDEAMALASDARSKSAKRGDVLCRQYEEGNLLFILLTGSVTVHIDYRQTGMLRNYSVKAIEGAKDSGNADAWEAVMQREMGRLVAWLRPGQVFGEVAKSKNQRRLCTAVAFERCELLIVGRREFLLQVAPLILARTAALRILKEDPAKRTRAEIQQLVEYLSRFHFFSRFEGVLLERCCRLVQAKTIPPGHVVCSQGDTGRAFYLVLSGQLGSYVRTMGPLPSGGGGSGNGAGEQHYSGKGPLLPTHHGGTHAGSPANGDRGGASNGAGGGGAGTTPERRRSSTADDRGGDMGKLLVNTGGGGGCGPGGHPQGVAQPLCAYGCKQRRQQWLAHRREREDAPLAHITGAIRRPDTAHAAAGHRVQGALVLAGAHDGLLGRHGHAHCGRLDWCLGHRGHGGGERRGGPVWPARTHAGRGVRVWRQVFDRGGPAGLHAHHPPAHGAACSSPRHVQQVCVHGGHRARLPARETAFAAVQGAGRAHARGRGGDDGGHLGAPLLPGPSARRPAQRVPGGHLPPLPAGQALLPARGPWRHVLRVALRDPLRAQQGRDGARAGVPCRGGQAQVAQAGQPIRSQRRRAGIRHPLLCRGGAVGGIRSHLGHVPEHPAHRRQVWRAGDSEGWHPHGHGGQPRAMQAHRALQVCLLEPREGSHHQRDSGARGPAAAAVQVLLVCAAVARHALPPANGGPEQGAYMVAQNERVILEKGAPAGSIYFVHEGLCAVLEGTQGSENSSSRPAPTASLPSGPDRGNIARTPKDGKRSAPGGSSNNLWSSAAGDAGSLSPSGSAGPSGETENSADAASSLFDPSFRSTTAAGPIVPLTSVTLGGAGSGGLSASAGAGGGLLSPGAGAGASSSLIASPGQHSYSYGMLVQDSLVGPDGSRTSLGGRVGHLVREGAVLGPGECFGEYAALHKARQPFTVASLVSPTRLYVAAAEEFFKLLPAAAIKRLTELSASRLEWRQQREASSTAFAAAAARPFSHSRSSGGPLSGDSDDPSRPVTASGVLGTGVSNNSNSYSYGGNSNTNSNSGSYSNSGSGNAVSDHVSESFFGSGSTNMTAVFKKIGHQVRIALGEGDDGGSSSNYRNGDGWPHGGGSMRQGAGDGEGGSGHHRGGGDGGSPEHKMLSRYLPNQPRRAPRESELNFSRADPPRDLVVGFHKVGHGNDEHFDVPVSPPPALGRSGGWVISRGNNANNANSSGGNSGGTKVAMAGTAGMDGDVASPAGALSPRSPHRQLSLPIQNMVTSMGGGVDASNSNLNQNSLSLRPATGRNELSPRSPRMIGAGMMPPSSYSNSQQSSAYSLPPGLPGGGGSGLSQASPLSPSRYDPADAGSPLSLASGPWAAVASPPGGSRGGPRSPSLPPCSPSGLLSPRSGRPVMDAVARGSPETAAFFENTCAISQTAITRELRKLAVLGGGGSGGDNDVGTGGRGASGDYSGGGYLNRAVSPPSRSEFGTTIRSNASTTQSVIRPSPPPPEEPEEPEVLAIRMRQNGLPVPKAPAHTRRLKQLQQRRVAGML